MAESRLGRLARLGTVGSRLASLRLGEAVRGASRKARRVRAAHEIAETLSTLKGAAMKAGQQLAVAAVALDLPPEVQSALGSLHKDAEPAPWWTISKTVEDELDDGIESLFQSFDKTPLGTASLAQAHAAVLPDGTKVVVKVLHAGVLEGLETDLMALRALLLGGRMLGRSKGELRDVLDEVEQHLREEVDYLQEAANIAEFVSQFEGDSRVQIPEVHVDLCTERVLVMDQVAGDPLSVFAATASDEAKQRAGLTLTSLFFEMAFHHRCLHADPHPGNYLFQPDGTVGLLDFGCVKRFDEFFLGQYARTVLAALNGDREGTLAAAKALGVWEGDTPEAGDAIWGFCDAALAPWRDGPRTLTDDGDLVERTQEAGKRIWLYPEIRGVRDMIFLHRSLGGLYALCKPLGPTADWGAMLREHMEHAIAVAEGTA